MPNLIVSTCGTGLPTNGADPQMRELLVSRSNEREIDENDCGRVEEWIYERRRVLEPAHHAQVAKQSLTS